MSRYDLPAALGFSERYGKTVLTIVMVIFFVVSLIGYVYLNFFSKSPDVSEVVIHNPDFDVRVIHQDTVRPGQTGNSLTLKVIPTSTWTITTPITLSVTELDPTFVVLTQDREKSFVLPVEYAQMQAQYDVVNMPGLPEKLRFQVTVKREQARVISQELSVNVSTVSAEQFALVSAIVTGLLSLWLFFGQEVFKSLIPKKE